MLARIYTWGSFPTPSPFSPHTLPLAVGCAEDADATLARIRAWATFPSPSPIYLSSCILQLVLGDAKDAHAMLARIYTWGANHSPSAFCLLLYRKSRLAARRTPFVLFIATRASFPFSLHLCFSLNIATRALFPFSLPLCFFLNIAARALG